MRWMWIDRIVELIPRQRLVAIKQVSMAEDHLHDHFSASQWHRLPAGEQKSTGGTPVPLFSPPPPRPPTPIMPASLIIEGMAQSAGILVGHAEGFKEKVVLAKVSRADLDLDAQPGDTLRYTAEIEQFSPVGASTRGTIELISWTAQGPTAPRLLGRIDLMFSHLDNNLAGEKYPNHNFVFSESFATLLSLSGIDPI
jgi:3-hydroxyacyl-[acyl-carrier-protein] dehydratase